ncbi:MAG: membrane protein insertion efficiency factor YidD [Coriobacteriales bacterium]|nr:membrane protein insertion efficiency factor YidD [Coriobacteriales bacterium]
MAIKRLPQKCALGLITFYRTAISPLTPPSCRYYPTCSEYALTSFKRFGFLKGLWLTTARIGRCHPFHAGGYDPVPETWEERRKH